ncbi:MAG: hypothetical protein KBT20_00880 [Bacteroidales bacterium]|nr:hypothetical protein [Candidatus Liminaster caballi]
MAKKKELHEDMLDFLKTKSSDPSELCTAAGRVLYVLMSAAIQMSDGDRDNIKMAIGMLEQMKQNIVEEFVNDDNDYFGRRRAAMESEAYAIETSKAVDLTDFAMADLRDRLKQAYHAGYVNGANHQMYIYEHLLKGQP